MTNLVLLNNVKRYKMSSIFKLMRIDGEMLDIPIGEIQTFGLDLNAQHFRFINFKIANYNDPNYDQYNFNVWINERLTNEIGDATLLYQRNVMLPYLRDDFNLYGVNQEPTDSEYRDYIFINIENIGTVHIERLFFSVTIEKLARGF